jgi:hypothetical protein
MDPSTTAIAYAAIVAFFSAGAAWGAVKTGLNGTRTKVDNLTQQLTSHITDEAASDSKTHERIARVETKVDIIIERMK